MDWDVKYTKPAAADLDKLDNSARIQVLKAIKKVSENPLPRPHGYGKPLGNHNSSDLTGFLKIKLKQTGLRIVYDLVKTDNIMRIIIISIRDDEAVYKEAEKRAKKL